MSRVAVKDALVLAVAADTTLKVVETADVPLVAQKLPAGAVTFVDDQLVAPGEVGSSRLFRYRVLLYVILADLKRAEAQLLLLADNLDANLATYRKLTTDAEVIGATNGRMDPGKFEGGPDMLVYETVVEVKQQAPLDALLYASGLTVTVRDVETESYPLQPPTLEIQPDSEGNLIAYSTHNQPEVRRITGRIQTVYEADALAGWLADEAELTYTDIRGVVSSGWRIAGAPTPRLDRRNLTAETFDVDITLWRV